MDKTKTMEAILAQLKNPFPVNLLHYRVGATTKKKDKAIPLFYITSRDVDKRFDEVLGAENWQKTTEIISNQNGVVAEKTTISIKTPNGEWISKDGVGEPSQIASACGAESQSYKRAAAHFGVGRYLYFVNIGWQPIDEYKNFKSDVRTLLPSWAEPSSNLEDWEKVAEKEFDSNVDLEDVADEATIVNLNDSRVEEIIKALKEES